MLLIAIVSMEVSKVAKTEDLLDVRLQEFFLKEVKLGILDYFQKGIVRKKITECLQHIFDFVQKQILKSDTAKNLYKKLVVIVQNFTSGAIVDAFVSKCAAHPVLTVSCAFGIIVIGFSTDAVLETYGIHIRAFGVSSAILAGIMAGCAYKGVQGGILGGLAGLGVWYLAKYFCTKWKSFHLQDAQGQTLNNGPEDSASSAVSTSASAGTVIDAPLVMVNAPIKGQI